MLSTDNFLLLYFFLSIIVLGVCIESEPLTKCVQVIVFYVSTLIFVAIINLTASFSFNRVVLGEEMLHSRLNVYLYFVCLIFLNMFVCS